MTDTGTGYGRPRPTFMRELTHVGAGTPMGELLRRYWHPVGLVGDAERHAEGAARARRGPGALPRPAAGGPVS